MTKVTREVAEKEVERWLDSKKIGTSKRESYAVYIEMIVNAIVDGDLLLNQDGSFTYNLKFIVGEDAGVSTLKLKPRMSLYERNKATQGIKADDGDGRLSALVAQLTDQPRAIISGLDTEDGGVLQAIALFFAQ